MKDVLSLNNDSPQRIEGFVAKFSFVILIIVQLAFDTEKCFLFFFIIKECNRQSENQRHLEKLLVTRQVIFSRLSKYLMFHRKTLASFFTYNNFFNLAS
jgi:hypothetical protein